MHQLYMACFPSFLNSGRLSVRIETVYVLVLDLSIFPEFLPNRNSKLCGHFCLLKSDIG